MRFSGGRSSCGPTRTSAGTSGTTSGHRRVRSMPLDDEVRFAISWKQRARQCPTRRVGAALISMMTNCCASPSRSSLRSLAKRRSTPATTCANPAGGAVVGDFADARPAHQPLLRRQPGRSLEHSDRRPAPVIGNSTGRSNRWRLSSDGPRSAPHRRAVAEPPFRRSLGQDRRPVTGSDRANRP